MAVLKSTAYGQVRKSVGANNYYRRAGVQLVRSKPTFAPGRVFTSSQLQKQFYMKIAQWVMETGQVSRIAHLMNCVNNKTYNASSRYNRAVGNILKNVQETNYPYNSTIKDFMMEYGENVLVNLSNGVVAQQALPTWGATTSSTKEIVFSPILDELNVLLNIANKKRNQANKLTLQNVGLALVLLNSNAPIESQMMRSYAVTSPASINEAEDEITYSIPNDIVSGASYVMAAYTFFVAPQLPSGSNVSELRPQFCTKSYDQSVG